jgi:hypothetical protein
MSAIMVNEGQVFKLNDVERDGADQTEISSGYEFILKGTIRSRHRFDHRLDKIYHLHCS